MRRCSDHGAERLRHQIGASTLSFPYPLRLLLIAAASFVTATATHALSLTGTLTQPSGIAGGVTISIERYPRTLRTRVPATDVLSVVTDASGRFSATLPAESFVIVLPKPAAGTGLSAVALEFELMSDLDIRLSLFRPVTLAGRLATPATRSSRLDVYSLSNGAFISRILPFDGTFELSLEPDVYSMHLRFFGAPGFSRVNVDARSGDVRNIILAIPIDQPVLDFKPPKARRVSISAADANGVATIRGEAGSVDPLATVLVANLQTRQMNFGVSDATGAFTLALFAPAGSPILVKHDVTGRYIANLDLGGGRAGTTEVPGGTILEVTAPAGMFSSAAQLYFASATADSIAAFRAFGSGDDGQVVVSGPTPPTNWIRGQPVILSGKLTLHARALEGIADLTQFRPNCSISLGLFSDEQGRNAQLHQQFVSSVLTPTGLPINRFGSGGINSSGFTISPLQRTGTTIATAEWSITVGGTNITPGIYRPSMGCLVDGLQRSTRYFDVFPSSGGGHYGRIMRLPVIRLGTTASPRLAWVLGLDDFSGGSRGTIAVQDRSRLGVASNVVINGATVLPMKDARTGQNIAWSLEPYAPMLSLGNNRLPDAPLVALQFPSGSLSVRITRPDGSVRDLGSAPFVQSRNRSHVNRGGQEASGASAHVTDFLQMTTLDPRFDVTFDHYGLHRIEVDGTIEDLNGNTYAGGGTYEIWIARPLDLEFGVTPGTPFEVGNFFTPSLIVQPPVAAEVELTLTLLPHSDTAKAITTTVRGRTNRFGFFSPNHPIVMPAAGEYRVDILARHTDSSGVMWAGAATWGTVVETPDSSLVTHGRRGFDGVNGIQDQWFEVRKARAGFDHVMFPFQSGDVMWMSDDDPAADIPIITLHDPVGEIAARVTAFPGPFDPPSLPERILAGEIPLYSTSIASDPSFEPDLAKHRGYFYAFAERPGVRVREQITEDQNGNGYWRFADNYQFQLGNGSNGDQPNDFKFQFGGAVWRDLTLRYYGAYASLFVMLPNQDPIGGRVFPPFQGNGGGPSGGPILRLKGKDVDLFFHPTGVRPGTILQLGETATFAGQLGPTLPGNVEIVVTSPSGVVRTLRGKASKIGYFYDPAHDFAVYEAGSWRVKVLVTFDGRISAGQVSAPFPTGDVLGSRQGEFKFYVVSPAAPPLAITPSSPSLATSPDGVRFVRPAGGPVTFTIATPIGLTGVELHTTTTMPGFILEEGTRSAISYAYDAQTLAKDFPNLDVGDADGSGGVDTISISFLLSGTDGTGARKHFGRQVVIQGEELQMPEQKETIVPPRRRSVRR